ncbi:MAG: PIN domain-containing protein [Actinomycetota bacterium]|nr:PIN domain-containing protein [Actinomycetota bacterium]
MTRALLDVNVLLALLDMDHIDHSRARAWLDAEIADGWASCAITQNGFVRVLSQPRYPNPVSPATAMDLLERACSTEHHAFWPCSVSLLDRAILDRTRLHGQGQVTDAYLLALAVSRGGRFVTFDRNLPAGAVVGARAEHLVVLGSR